VISIILATGIGALYAYQSYKESTSALHEHQKTFEHPSQGGSLKELIQQINKFYQVVLRKREELARLETSDPKQPKFSFAAAVDRTDFLLRGRLLPKNRWGKFKRMVSDVWAKTLIFVGGAESGSYLFRVIFGAVSSLLGISLLGNPPLIIAIAVAVACVGLGFGITALCHRWGEKTLAKERASLEQLPLIITGLNTEYAVLTKLINERKPRVSTADIRVVLIAESSPGPATAQQKALGESDRENEGEGESPHHK